MRTITRIAIHRPSESPIFGTGNIVVEITDEAAGPFFIIHGDDGEKLRLDPDEIVEIAKVAKVLLRQPGFNAAPQA